MGVRKAFSVDVDRKRPLPKSSSPVIVLGLNLHLPYSKLFGCQHMVISLAQRSRQGMSQLEPESFSTKICCSSHSALGESGVGLDTKTPKQCLANRM